MNAAAIQEAYEKFIESEERRSAGGQRQYVYASQWSACTRQMALEMLRPDAKVPFPADTLANFRRGNDRARDIKADMTKVGRFSDPPFDVVGAEERFELKDKKGRVAIVGKVDFRVKYPHIKEAPPVEVKSWHPNLIQNVKRFEDLFANRWTRKGAFQLLAYLLATNEPVGIMLLDRPGIPRLLQVHLYEYLDKIENFLSRAEEALDHREKWNALVGGASPVDVAQFTLPDFIDDPSECRVCPFFGHACNPPLKYEGASIITEDSLLAEIANHEALKPQHKEYDSSHDYLKDVLKEMTETKHGNVNHKQIVAGQFLIESWYSKNTFLDMPDDVKKKYQASDDTGKFNFKVTRVSE